MPSMPYYDRINDAAACLICLAKGSQDCPHGPSTPAEVRVLEVEAFGSVQDLIHASIASRGGQASLAHIYQLCHSRGRVAYRRSGGSRLITQNEHWKSQIRHTLYTNPRFERCPDDPDMWRLTPGKTISPPSIVRVLVRTDEVAAQTAPPPEASRGSAAGGAADRYPGASGHCQLDTPPLRHRRATFPATSTSDCEVEQRPVPGGSPARPPAGLNAPRRHATGRAAAPATSTDASSASARPEPAPVSRQRRPAEACDPGMNTMGASCCVQPRPAVRRRTRFPSAEARPESCAGDAAELCWGAKARRSSCAARSPPRDYKKAPSGRSTLCDDGGALASLAAAAWCQPCRDRARLTAPPQYLQALHQHQAALLATLRCRHGSGTSHLLGGGTHTLDPPGAGEPPRLGQLRTQQHPYPQAGALNVERGATSP
uniref:Fork-head domain-containing protein n=2 Tax=Auxenochlorella protothecoides TaxID=3075 RepID=A0A1D1ZYZ4_AUXPR